RLEDVPELVLHFLQQCGQRAGRRPWTIDDEAMLALKAFDWPGNVRQLENAIERAVVSAEGGVVTLADLPPEIGDSGPWRHCRRRRAPAGLQRDRARALRPECQVRAGRGGRGRALTAVAVAGLRKRYGE